MLVQPEIAGGIGISADACAFPRDCPVAHVTVTVEGKPYRAYFDRSHHEHGFVQQVEEDISNATYVFLHLFHKTSYLSFFLSNVATVPVHPGNSSSTRRWATVTCPNSCA